MRRSFSRPFFMIYVGILALGLLIRLAGADDAGGNHDTAATKEDGSAAPGKTNNPARPGSIAPLRPWADYSSGCGIVAPINVCQWKVKR